MTRLVSMNRRFGVLALAGAGRLKAGHQTSSPHSQVQGPNARQQSRQGSPWTNETAWRIRV